MPCEMHGVWLKTKSSISAPSLFLRYAFGVAHLSMAAAFLLVLAYCCDDGEETTQL